MEWVSAYGLNSSVSELGPVKGYGNVHSDSVTCRNFSLLD
jgi:hypothetical protein